MDDDQDRSGLLQRLRRFLQLGERLLEDAVGTPPSAVAFRDRLAFRWDATRRPGRLRVIDDPHLFDLEDLVGVDDAVARLVENTAQFVRGLPANHVLLFGDRGTGKSSAVRGVLEKFADQGLRLVDVRKEDLMHLPNILAAIREGCDRHRVLVFCDDLSFGAGEPGYRELKAVLDGSIDGPPENVCLIVTSNRRHLVSQSMSDNREAVLDQDNELHLGEALEEKLALADRFGLTLGFYCFNQDTYLEIVANYLARAGVAPLDDTSRAAALRWARRRGARSGRTARQFVNDWVGRLRVENQ